MRAVFLLLLPLLAGCSAIRPQAGRGELRKDEWASHDGKTMPWRAWETPPGVPRRGIVIAVHGLSGAKSDFWYLGERLAPLGHAVYAYDLRGQGNDPVEAERGDIANESLWLRDLATFHSLVRRRHPGTPVFWHGESLGSLIALHTAVRAFGGRQAPDGLILASPVAGLRVPVGALQRLLLETCARLAPRARVSLGQLAGVEESQIQVTSASTHGGQMAVTPHHVGAFSLRLLTSVGRMMDGAAGAARRLKTPVLFVASPNDVISSPDQIQRLFDQTGAADKKLLWYTRSYHLLLHDVQRAEVAGDVSRWLDRQLKRR